MRLASNIGRILRIKSMGIEREKAFSELVEENFYSKLAETIAKPKSSQSVALKKLIKPSVKIVGSKLDWTLLQRVRNCWTTLRSLFF